ncbi:hypothetical protein CTI12_AA559080 [Artemisia annua]|uniref:RRM domain-containing protein n=1 Tax=Artemisia annua TaxID=35608 RepID=A0A2U1KQA0_ARTAN|nr:hypothetical protein CTI12_AA559080 [Artemisia annua]
MEAEEAVTKNQSGSEEGNDHGWQQVPNRKAKSSNISSGLNDGVYGNGNNPTKNPKTKINLLERMSMSFYLTNFPHQVTAKDMWNRCSKWGTVADVFIPNRLSKAGRRFGFVRFIKVDNAARLLSDLKSMWFGNYLVFADLVKYSRIHEKRNVKPNTKKPEMYGNRTSDKGEHGVSKPAMSYVEVLSGPKAGINVDINSGKASSSQERRLVKLPSFSSSNDFEEKAKPNLSMLVKIVEPCNIPQSSQWLIDEDADLAPLRHRVHALSLMNEWYGSKFLAYHLVRGEENRFKS